jgi:hypothetical protein
MKIFNVANNDLEGPFPAFLYSNLTAIMAQYCMDPASDCHLWVAVNGGGNRLACPAQRIATHSGLLPEDFAHLKRQGLGCVGADGGDVYEISSVLQGSPVLLAAAADDAAGSPDGRTFGAARAVPPGAAPPEVKAAARAAADAISSGQMTGPPAPAWWSRRVAGVPVGAAIGIAVGVLAGVALVAALAYVVVYRRWWSVRAATRFQKFHEGPLAAAGGASASSCAPDPAGPPRGGGGGGIV